MPRGSGGKSRVRGGSTKKQRRAKAPRGSSGSPGGKMTSKLKSPNHKPGRHV